MPSRVGPRTRRAIIHAGTEKTGTTAIQHALADNRQALAERGVIYPRSFGAVNHTRLVAAAEDDGVVDNIKSHLQATRRETEAELRASLRQDAAEELGADPDWHTLVISSELIHSRLHTPSEIERLCSFFQEHVDEISVIVVLRRQDQLALSRFSSAIRSGHTGYDDVFEDLSGHIYVRLPEGREVNDLAHFYDYRNLLDRFSALVPPERVRVHIYDGGGKRMDPISMIAGEIGVERTLLGPEDSIMNPAMSLEAQIVIAMLNRSVPSLLPDGRRNVGYVRIKREIEATLQGGSRQIGRTEAEAFYQRFAASNEAVRTRHFPEAPSLFSGDFGMYPEEAVRDVTRDDLQDIVERYLQTYREAEVGAEPPKEWLVDRIRKRSRAWFGRDLG